MFKQQCWDDILVLVASLVVLLLVHT